jgi:hypothetical protein
VHPSGCSGGEIASLSIASKLSRVFSSNFEEHPLTLFSRIIAAAALTLTSTLSFASSDALEAQSLYGACNAKSAGQYAIDFAIVNGQIVQVAIYCDGSYWVPATYHTNPQVVNEGVAKP